MRRKQVARATGAEAQGALARGAEALGAKGLGALAAGAVATGAVAIGALTIRSLAVRRAKIQRLSIDELEVRRLRVGELIIEEQREAPHPFAYLEGQQYVSLTTFRKSGEPVPTPIWFALHDGKLYATTDPDSGKMKRIRNDPRVVLQPCNAWGKPRGASVEGVARTVEDLDMREAEAVLRRKYRLGLPLFNLVTSEGAGQITLEVRPVDPEGSEEG